MKNTPKNELKMNNNKICFHMDLLKPMNKISLNDFMNLSDITLSFELRGYISYLILEL
jgi:hypothetical protein